METIGQSALFSYLGTSPHATAVRNTQVRKDRGHFVKSYLELATKVAELQFRNRNHVLMFRGQSRDYRNEQKNTSLKASLFRGAAKRNPDEATLAGRFETLQRAESLLVDNYTFLGRERVLRYRIIRWSILQHYEVCATPLIDVTHSLRIAASFASAGDGDEAYVFVIGVPNVSGAITESAEAGIQIVRLSSVCPPVAVRPHVQEGYLLGEYPEMTAFAQKQLYAHYEVDFGRRLVAKFRFNPHKFWKKGAFPKVDDKALYPTPRSDPFARIAREISRSLAVA
jgi:FRG domain-containing protein